MAIAPAMYRQTFAHTLNSKRPSVEVRMIDPADLDREVDFFNPDLLVCHETTPEVRERVFSWIEIRYSNGLDALVSVGGRESKIEDIKIEDLLTTLDETEELISRS